MGRLIKEDDVIKIIDEELALRCGYDSDIALLSVKRNVAKLKTTYDVEKVVTELERMRIDESQGCHNVITVKCNGYKNCEDCIFDRATEIVRKGGVNE